MTHDRSNSPILVTGAHRSGSTFVGKMLAAHPEIGYINEPFNKDFGLEDIPCWFFYLKEGMAEEPHFRAMISDLLHGRGRFRNPSRPNPSGRLSRKIARRFLRSKNNLEYIVAKLDPRVKRYLIKDPIACMSAEYLHHAFNMQVVALFRHPGAFVASLKRMDWRFGFHDFESQTELMHDHLKPLLNGHRRSGLSPAEEGVLLWNCIYATLDRFCQRNEHFIAVRHEDLSFDPLLHFERLYNVLGIDFTETCKEKIRRYTGVDNPTDPEKGETHTLARNSRENIKRWKKLLSDEEIHLIREETGAVAERYYGPEDW